MNKRAAGQQERQKVQVVSCPCCEARLALHFVHGSNEVYDVELVSTAAPSRMGIEDDNDKAAVEVNLGPISSPCSISETPAAAASSDSYQPSPARSIAPKLALLKPQVILVSPLTRALQTLCGAFPSAQETRQPRVEVTALHAEHVMCSGDVGRPPQVLAGEYPWLSFDALPEVWWYSQPKLPNDAMKMEFNSVEPMEELRKRELTSTRQRMMNCEIRTLML